MKFHFAIPLALGTVAFACSAAADVAQAQMGDTGAQTSPDEQQKLVLTPEQRRAIYAAVTKDRSKTARTQFAAKVGADVPPMLELYPLPDQVVAENQAANFYEYTIERNEVVLVDPTKMRVVDVIGPNH
jgi:Spy/CpxP family protein refolding chaperone